MTENCICQSHDLDDLIFGPDSTLITRGVIPLPSGMGI